MQGWRERRRVRRGGSGDDVLAAPIDPHSEGPALLSKLVRFVAGKGAGVDGLFILPVDPAELDALKRRVRAERESVALAGGAVRVEVAAELLKIYLDLLPEALTTAALYDAFLLAVALPPYARLAYLRHLLASLPNGFRAALRLVLGLLHRVAHAAANPPAAVRALAAVFAARLVRSDEDEEPHQAHDAPLRVALCEALVSDFELLLGARAAEPLAPAPPALLAQSPQLTRLPTGAVAWIVPRPQPPPPPPSSPRAAPAATLASFAAALSPATTAPSASGALSSSSSGPSPPTVPPHAHHPERDALAEAVEKLRLCVNAAVAAVEGAGMEEAVALARVLKTEKGALGEFAASLGAAAEPEPLLPPPAPTEERIAALRRLALASAARILVLVAAVAQAPGADAEGAEQIARRLAACVSVISSAMPLASPGAALALAPPLAPAPAPTSSAAVPVEQGPL